MKEVAMAYHYTKRVSAPFDEAVARTREVLSRHGFGVLTEIDVKETIQKKIGEELPPYRILGACNPRMAHRALQIEPYIGTMLPCNVIVRQTSNGESEVSAVDPVLSMQAVENERLKVVAGEVRDSLRAVIDEVAEICPRKPEIRVS